MINRNIERKIRKETATVIAMRMFDTGKLSIPYDEVLVMHTSVATAVEGAESSACNVIRSDARIEAEGLSDWNHYTSTTGYEETMGLHWASLSSLLEVSA